MTLWKFGEPGVCQHGQYRDQPCDKCEIERLQAALLEQAGLWDLAKPILDVADARVCRVPFMELHEPDKKAREAARAEVGE